MNEVVEDLMLGSPDVTLVCLLLGDMGAGQKVFTLSFQVSESV